MEKEHFEEEFQKLETTLKESEAYAAVVFGSFARGEDFRDIDVAVFTDGSGEHVVKEAPGIFDISVFSDLPMNIRKRVLEEGEVFYCIDRDRFYDTAINFAREYEDFRPIYRDYIEGVKSRG
jgi:predicted nucleotidyltransferase